MSKPLGELKKLVSLVDRSDFDNTVYPADATQTKFQGTAKPYHNFTKEMIVLPFSGRPDWGQRITFEVPWPWQADLLNWVALRLKPNSWLTTDVIQRLSTDANEWEPVDPANFWIWANGIGTIAIERAEMEVDGIILESFSGDWLNVWNKTHNGVNRAIGFDDSIYGERAKLSVSNIQVSEDGYVYCYLPFMFSRYNNTPFPLCSTRGPNTVRFHITLRPFSKVVRKLSNPLLCDETPINKQFTIRDNTYRFLKRTVVNTYDRIPTFSAADVLCGVSHIDGDLRKEYIEQPHEIMVNPVVESSFNEPLKYTINTSVKDTIKISLPLPDANGPLKQILFFIRRKAAIDHYNDWNNYSAMLSGEADTVWNPEKPLLQRAQLMAGTAVWADEAEQWWRASANSVLPGGVRGYGSYIYGYNFAEKPTEFAPSGSLNASRVDLKLNLTVTPPAGGQNTEWTVSVFIISTNWIRFQNGIANMLFSD